MYNIPFSPKLQNQYTKASEKRQDETGYFYYSTKLKLFNKIKDPFLAYMAPDKVDAYNASNKAGLDYSHDFVGK